MIGSQGHRVIGPLVIADLRFANAEL